MKYIAVFFLVTSFSANAAGLGNLISDLIKKPPAPQPMPQAPKPQPSKAPAGK